MGHFAATLFHTARRAGRPISPAKPASEGFSARPQARKSVCCRPRCPPENVGHPARSREARACRSLGRAEGSRVGLCLVQQGHFRWAPGLGEEVPLASHGGRRNWYSGSWKCAILRCPTGPFVRPIGPWWLGRQGGHLGWFGGPADGPSRPSRRRPSSGRFRRRWPGFGPRVPALRSLSRCPFWRGPGR